MAERRAMQKYYPPEWTPDKGSINKFVGQHPLRDRARKLNQGILIIRFELPFNIWCGGCGNHIGMGVRYNAEKKKVGMYHTTPIWSFRMKCHLCDNWFEIQTDPQNTAYNVVEGARRKVETWDAKDSETIDIGDDEEHKKRLVDDAMYRLEHGEADKRKATEAKPRLVQLQDMQSKWKDDYDLNCALRRKFRADRKELQRIEAEAKRIQEKASLAIKILPEAKEDIERAAGMRYTGQLKPGFREHRHKKRLEIVSQSIFDSRAAPASRGFGAGAGKSAGATAQTTESERAHKLELLEKKRKIGVDHRNFRVLGVEGHLGHVDVDVAGLVQPKRRRTDSEGADEGHGDGTAAKHCSEEARGVVVDERRDGESAHVADVSTGSEKQARAEFTGTVAQGVGGFGGNGIGAGGNGLASLVGVYGSDSEPE